MNPSESMLPENPSRPLTSLSSTRLATDTRPSPASNAFGLSPNGDTSALPPTPSPLLTSTTSTSSLSPSHFKPLLALGTYVTSFFYPPASSSPTTPSSVSSLSSSLSNRDISAVPPIYPSFSASSSTSSSMSFRSSSLDRVQHTPDVAHSQTDAGRPRSESILSVFSSEPPLSLKDREEDTVPLLTRRMASSIRKYLPATEKLTDAWVLLFSMDQHGASLNTLYHRVMRSMESHTVSSKACLLFLEDSMGKIFGAFLTDGLKVHSNFYGTGEMFVFEWSSEKEDMFVYPWTGANDYFAFCEHSYFAIGAGEGHFAIYLDSNLEHGKSHTVPTFNNPVLSHATDFVCVGLEIWGFD